MSIFMPNRRQFLLASAAGAVAAAVVRPGVAWADGITVPVPLQAKLLAKVAKYDRNMPKRASGSLKVAVLDNGSGSSASAAAKLASAVGNISSIAGVPASAEVTKFSSAGSLKGAVKSGGVAIVYITPGMSGDVSGLAGALSGVSVLTVGAVGSYAGKGAVLSFDLVEGKPKIMVNLGQAKKQQVSFHPNFLKLAEIVD